MSIVAATIFVGIAAFLSIAFPLATYTLTLATLGLTHVLTELHYIDNRFSPRVDSDLRLKIGHLLALIIVCRSLQILGFIPTGVGIVFELSCGVALVAVVLPILAKQDWRLGVLATVLCIILAIGIFGSPTLTLLIFAILHNVTPVGFIAEKLRGWQRHRTLWVCAIVFLLIPSVILSGLPYRFLSSIDLVSLQALWLNVGSLELHLGAFLPQPLHHQAIAIHAFSAAVFLQVMHYAVVIGVLPKWETLDRSQKASDVFFSGEPKRFRWFAIFLSSLLWVGFTVSFFQARAVYGIVAAIHSWVEIPILLLALARPEIGNQQAD